MVRKEPTANVFTNPDAKCIGSEKPTVLCRRHVAVPFNTTFASEDYVSFT